MKRLPYVGLLSLMAVVAWGQSARHRKTSALPTRPDAAVSGLYKEVVARHPLGIPYGADMRAFAPYLSKGLLHRFYVSNACFADWRRQNPGSSLKPPVGLIENGIFSGGNEEAEPQAFSIERTESGKDSPSRVYVKLTLGYPPEKPLSWYVVVVLVHENGRPVVNNILYLKDRNGAAGSSLSKDLSTGCDGARWIGTSNQP